MKRNKSSRRQGWILKMAAVFTFVALTQFEAFSADVSTPGQAGGGGLWALANLIYAGMRAQNSPSAGWRIIAFICGFPGTLLTYFVVTEGGERAYGVDLPRKH